MNKLAFLIASTLLATVLVAAKVAPAKGTEESELDEDEDSDSFTRTEVVIDGEYAQLIEDLQREMDANLTQTPKGGHPTRYIGVRVFTDYSMYEYANHSRRELKDRLVTNFARLNRFFKSNFGIEHVMLEIRMHVLPNTTAYNQQVRGGWNTTALFEHLNAVALRKPDRDIAVNIFYTHQLLYDNGVVNDDELVGGMTKKNSALVYAAGWQMLMHYTDELDMDHVLRHEMMHAYGLDHNVLLSERYLMHPYSFGNKLTLFEHLRVSLRIELFTPFFTTLGKLDHCGNSIVEAGLETCERNLPIPREDELRAHLLGQSLVVDEEFDESNCDIFTCQPKNDTTSHIQMRIEIEEKFFITKVAPNKHFAFVINYFWYIVALWLMLLAVAIFLGARLSKARKALRLARPLGNSRLEAEERKRFVV